MNMNGRYVHRVRWMQNLFSELIFVAIMFLGKYSLDISWFDGEKYEKKVTRANYKKFRFRPNTHRRRYNLKQNWNKLLLLSNFLGLHEVHINKITNN